MSMDNIKKPDSLIEAVDKVVELCPYYSDHADDGEKMDMDSAVAELKSAFREYADLIERDVIKLTRNYQAEYEEMWQDLIEENEIFDINLDSLMNKNRHLEDKLHGFIAKKADIIFEYSRRDFNNILRYNTDERLMPHIDKYISIGILQMKTHISNVLNSHDSAIRNKCFKSNMLDSESVKKATNIKRSLSGKYKRLRGKAENLKINDSFENTLGIMVKDIMENESYGSYTGIKQRVCRTRKRN